MFRIKVRQLGEGQHPSEVVVAVATADGGEERLIVDRRSLSEDSLAIGYPVGQKDGQYLIELPRETFRGTWRVWVRREGLSEVAA